MTSMRRLALGLVTIVLAAAASAAPLAPATRAEIDGLLSRLVASGCEFNRNGTWHAAGEAAPHLLRKLKYLEDRGAVRSTEQFIELAASSSSTTGQAYQVRCGTGPVVPSATWLQAQLQLMRAGGRGSGAASDRAP